MFFQAGYSVNDVFLKIRCQRIGKYIVNLMDLGKGNLAGQIFPYIIVKIADGRFAVIFKIAFQPSTVKETVAVICQFILKTSNI